jgi:hybrid cluster-associated redox disulfide protein
VDIKGLAEMSIAELLQRWPEVAVAFQRRRMACIGCALAPFYNPVDAAMVYGFPVEPFLDELAGLIGAEDAAEEGAGGAGTT